MYKAVSGVLLWKRILYVSPENPQIFRAYIFTGRGKEKLLYYK